MLSDKQIKNLLKLLFDGSDYSELFSIIDTDMRRKAAITIRKVKEYKEKEEETYTVQINWRLVERFLGGKE